MRKVGTGIVVATTLISHLDIIFMYILISVAEINIGLICTPQHLAFVCIVFLYIY